MGVERALQAISRIERAVARIEAGASRPATPSATGPSDNERRLAPAHSALRGKVEAAIAQIDALLATAEHR